MIKAVQKNLPYFQFHCFQKFSDELVHGVLQRNGGVSKPPFDSLNLSFNVGDSKQSVEKNRAIVVDVFDFENENIFSAKQAHGKNIIVIDEETIQMHDSKKEYENTDAFITRFAGIVPLIQVADCQAILMFDPVKKVIANVHAGWKGLAQNITAEVVKKLEQDFGVNPENLLVGISPSLGPCCAFFSDPEKELPVEFGPYIKENKAVDLWQFSVDQLHNLGIPTTNIELARVCSFCGAGNKFFSYRRDKGVTGRFGAFLSLKPTEFA